MATKFPRPQYGLSVAHLYATARMVDWSDEETGLYFGDDWSVTLPRPTYGDWQQNGSDFPARIARRKADAKMSPSDVDAFQNDDEAFDQWRDSFAPMMNYAWPVSLAYGVDALDAADLIDAHGPSCSLVELSEKAKSLWFGDDSDAPEYVIALSGGGMNLSDHIAAAYLACGAVPPLRILEGLAGVISPERAARIPLAQAYGEAQRMLQVQAGRMAEQSSRIFSKEA